MMISHTNSTDANLTMEKGITGPNWKMAMLPWAKSYGIASAIGLRDVQRPDTSIGDDGRDKMKLPRWMHYLYAFFNGYYWSRCPICGQMYGGHESADIDLMTSFTSGICVCSRCAAEAIRRNEEYIKAERRVKREYVG